LKLKVKALLKRENTWDIVETKTILDLVLTTIGGLNFIEQQFKQLKNKALSMKDDLVNILVKHDNHASAWKVLKDIFQIGYLVQVLLILTKLYNRNISRKYTN
jgi:hypothetical protein